MRWRFPVMAAVLALVLSCGSGTTPPSPLATAVQEAEPSPATAPPPETVAVSSPALPPPAATETPAPTPGISTTVVALQKPRAEGSFPSPDGRWRAEVVVYDCVKAEGPDEYAYEMLRVGATGGDDARTADDQLRACGGLGAFGLKGLFWSPNSRYFYYTDAREGVPDGCGTWEPPLLRLALPSLERERLGAGPVSPDGAWIATWQGRELVVWDAGGGEIGRTAALAPDAAAGPIAWSPDGRALVYVQFASDCPLSGKSLIVLVELPGFAQALLVESETPTFGSARWDTGGEVRLFDENGDEWRYVLGTRELNRRRK